MAQHDDIQLIGDTPPEQSSRTPIAQLIKQAREFGMAVAPGVTLNDSSPHVLSNAASTLPFAISPRPSRRRGKRQQ